MRTPGICLALIASAQLVIVSSPAFAADAPAAPDAEPATTTPAPAAPAPKAASKEATAGDGMVTVHIKADKEVTLQKRAGNEGSWETVCTSPCDQAVSVSDQYQVIGEGVNASKPFMLSSASKTANLDVTVGSEKTRTTGIIVLAGGGVLVVAGVLTAIIAGGNHGLSGAGGADDGRTHNGNTNAFWWGGALVFAGIATGIYGGALYANSAHSQVEGDVAKPAPVRGQVLPDSGHYEARNARPTTQAWTVPVFQTTF